jgi:hypothetical protein
VSEQPEQRSLGWVQSATPRQVDQALKAGELAELLAGRDPGSALSHDEIAAMTSAELVEAARDNPHIAGRLGQADQGARARPSILDGSPEEVRAAFRRGDFDALMRGD